MMNNCSQEFGVQSANQDSSAEVNGGALSLYGLKQSVDATMGQAASSKKSDWTMEMPKIEYQPEQDDDDSDSAFDGVLED